MNWASPKSSRGKSSEEGAERGMWAGGPTGGLGEGRGVRWVGMVQGLSWDTK